MKYRTTISLVGKRVKSNSLYDEILVQIILNLHYNNYEMQRLQIPIAAILDFSGSIYFLLSIFTAENGNVTIALKSENV